MAATRVHRLQALAAVLVMGLLLSEVQAEEYPQVNLLGTNTVITGVYIPYSETRFLDITTTMEGFLGIPYATPPVGELRFKPPEVKDDLGESYSAQEHRALCNQKAINPDPEEMSEDCLYLGIWTSSPRPTSAPVMVWFHGGSYTSGGGSWSSYEPLSLLAMAPDMVVVNVNYRLGVIGFLTTGDETSPGNYGMHDQVMALQWVQDNIASFGGDPSRVTIMGQSAGGGSVGLHTLSPLSKGFFSQAIMQSGAAFCPWAVDTNMTRQLDFTTQLAEMVNCTPSMNDAMMDCLRLVDERDLVRAQTTLIIENLMNELLFVPVVDGDFLPDIPIELIKRKNFTSVPTMIGVNEDDGSLIALRVFPEYVIRKDPPLMTLEKFREVLPDYMYWDVSGLVPAVEQWYIDWTQADNSSANQLQQFIDLNTDQVYACAAEITARAMEATGSPVYRYEMTHDPSWSLWAGIPGWLGAGHAEELQYVYGWELNPTLMEFAKQTDEEIVMSIQFIRYWTNFIRTGNPNTPLSSGEYPEWPEYSLPEQGSKLLSLTMDNTRGRRMNACAFWLRYVPELYINDPNQVYEDWKKENSEWSDVHMPAWEEVFAGYKDDNGCPSP